MKRNRRILVLIVVALLSSAFVVFAQMSGITGYFHVITADDGEPAIAAAILVLGNNGVRKGAITDVEGRTEISGTPYPGKYYVFYIGYEYQEHYIEPFTCTYSISLIPNDEQP